MSMMLVKCIEAVETLVNAASSFAVYRSYPDFALELTQDDNARIDVVPAGFKTVDFSSRDMVVYRCLVDIVLRYRFSSGERNRGISDHGEPNIYSTDQLVEELEAIADYITEHRRIGTDEAFDAVLADDKGIDFRAVYIPEHLGRQQYTGILRVSYDVTKHINAVG